MRNLSSSLIVGAGLIAVEGCGSSSGSSSGGSFASTAASTTKPAPRARRRARLPLPTSSGSPASATPGSTTTTTPPVGTTPGSTAPVSKIDHIFIIVKENHSFDNYFGTFPGANGSMQAVDSSGATRRSGHPGPTTTSPDPTTGPPRHTDWNNGLMDSFDKGEESSFNVFLASRRS